MSLEEGILRQVHAVAVGQEVNVWVLERTRVCLIVDRVELEGAAPGEVGFLGNDTQVVVAP